MDDFGFGKTVQKALEEAVRERGHANVLIAGRTGVGKSTLINAVFQGRFATTGQGRPVTQNTREITKEGLPLTIFDTRGLELKEFGATLKELEKFAAKRNKDRDPRQHIHVAWICIAEDLRRVEEAESLLAAELSKHMPVLGVITKARADRSFRAEVQRLLPTTKNVVRVRAIPEELDDGHRLEPMGLVELVQATIELFPEGQQRAFVAAQKADLKLKKTRAHIIVGSAAASAVGVAAAPIPVADAALLVPIQVAMLAGITATYGMTLAEGYLTTLVASTVGGTAATLTGRFVASGILKLIPGAGSAIGGAIAAVTAGAITTTLGESYIAVLDRLFAEGKGEAPAAADVIEAVRERFETARRER